MKIPTVTLAVLLALVGTQSNFPLLSSIRYDY